jgi:hypothetical protein
LAFFLLFFLRSAHSVFTNNQLIIFLALREGGFSETCVVCCYYYGQVDPDATASRHPICIAEAKVQRERETENREDTGGHGLARTGCHHTQKGGLWGGEGAEMRTVVHIGSTCRLSRR